MVVNNMNAGSAIASKAPLMTRRAAKVAKFLETACSLVTERLACDITMNVYETHISTAPHMKMLKER
jgi:hypothetical protein